MKKKIETSPGKIDLTLDKPCIRCSKCHISKELKDFTRICKKCTRKIPTTPKTYYATFNGTTFIAFAYSPPEARDKIQEVYNTRILIKEIKRLWNTAAV